MKDLAGELKKIWDKLEGTGTMRASLFNLIVVAPDNQRREYVRKITDNVIKRFPCRVIFITIVDILKEIKVHVSATSEIEGIACDMIEIAAPPSLLHKIPFLILPHFLPDLPIYLLWAENPSLHTDLLKELQKWATRLIYDSEVASNLSDFCRTLTLESKTREVADLNWARTENWRELIAATFYSPARLASLQSALTVKIEYNNFERSVRRNPTPLGAGQDELSVQRVEGDVRGPTSLNRRSISPVDGGVIQIPFFCHTKIQALYLEAWLKTCLNWSPTVTFVPHLSKELAPGTVLSIEITCKDQFHYAFSRDPEHLHQIRTIICDEDKCDIPSRFIFSKAQTGLSLVNLIYHPDPSTHFPKVLNYLKDKQ